MMQEDHYLVPEQLHGFEKNIAYKAVVNSIEDAEDWFVDAKERLLDVNNWKKYSIDTGLGFRLIDSHGKILNRKAHKGDHISIDAVTMHMADWVTIEALEYDDYPDADMETFAMRVKSDTGNATSTLVIERKGRNLEASYHGRNQAEEITTAGTGNAAWLGLSDTEWTALVKGLIK